MQNDTGLYPKISIVTVTFNSAKTLRDTVESVIKQDYQNIEYIIIDGNSSDNTVDIIKQYAQSHPIKWISESDKGLYDAMNKGIKMATGDYIGIINSDDFYHKINVISTIATVLKRNNIDCVYGDVRFVNPQNLYKTVRYYSSKNFKPSRFSWGFMPAHPTCFIKKELFEKYGYYKTNFKIAADFELLLRFLLKNRSTYFYVSTDMLKMRIGGVSTRSLKAKLVLNREVLSACKENGVSTNIFKISSKVFVKLFQLMVKRK